MLALFHLRGALICHCFLTRLIQISRARLGWLAPNQVRDCRKGGNLGRGGRVVSDLTHAVVQVIVMGVYGEKTLAIQLLAEFEAFWIVQLLFFVALHSF